MSAAAIPPDAVAVIGMAGRFPGAPDIAQFWRNLAAGAESIARFGRAELAARGVPTSVLDDPLHVPAGAVLEGVETFDAAFFGLSPREAELTDPQHRVFLECAWEALEDSGIDPNGYDGLIGVYAGAGPSTYLLHCLLRRPDVLRSAGALALQLGNNKDYVPLRVSYKLGLRGPSVNVNTACSSSLVAVHLACQSLIDHQCDIALAGGVGIQVPQDQGYLHAPNGILSPDGHCRAFDVRAEGTVGGNGAGIVVLRRLAEAMADGNAIRAVILGSAINNDGGDKVGFTAPSVSGQAQAIAEALALAGVGPETIGCIEAHGTGTPLGDPVEVAALTQVFGGGGGARRRALGSVKTNIGHLDEAAGVAGLIKAVLALRHAAIPPSLHFERPNPEIDLAPGGFYVPTRLVPWEAESHPRRAGVSSFGIGGTNAHAVLQEAPEPAPAAPARSFELLLLSARTEAALEAMTARLAAHLRATPDLALGDVAHTLRVGRKAFPHRRMLLCRDREEAVAALETRAPDRCATALAPAAEQGVVFLLPGQGSQHVGMGRGLYRAEPAFRDALDRCAEHLRPELGLDLRQVLYPEPQGAAEAQARLARTELAQPALFAVEYALAQLLLARGIRPRAMIGHSLGEYVAACLAGVFSCEDGLSLVAARGRLMQAMPPGGMLAVELAEPELAPWLGGELALALANAPSLSVVAGPLPALASLEAALAARGIACHRLRTSHAFHSPAMDPVLDPLVARLRQVTLGPPTIPYVSNLTGRWITAAEATDPRHWARQLRAAVRFSDGVRLLLQEADQVFLEVGPGQALAGMVRRQDGAAERPVLSAMRHPQDRRDDTACLLDALGRLWLAGACRKPEGIGGDGGRRRVPLPTYPFERKRFWIDPPAEDAAPGREVEGWFHLPSWRRCPDLPPSPAGGDGWLLFRDPLGLGDALAERLRRLGRRVVMVEPGPGFAQRDDAAFVLDPRRPEDYAALLERLRATGGVPRSVAHLWSVGPVDRDPAGRWERAQDLGFRSLLFLVQAAGRQGIAERLSLSAVSVGMQAVRGTDLACPEKATLLGVVRVAPLEFPGLRCRSIDLALPESGPWDAAALLDPLLAALEAEDAAPVLALRDGVAWEQVFAPRRLPAPASLPACLRRGGTYLITGGLGSMGLAMARHLAREAQARVVLLGRTGLPAGGLDLDPAAVADCIAAQEAAAEAEAAPFGIDADARLQDLLHGVCRSLIAGYLREAGIELRTGEVHGRAALRRRLKLRPVFDGMLGFLLRTLAEDGVLALEGDRVTVLDDRRLGPPEAERRAILAEYPRFEGVLRLLEHCANQYRPALSGEIPSISVLYPDGTPALMEECGRHVPAYARDGVYLRIAAALVVELAAASPDRPLRILEVGGGSGGLTRAVLAALQGRLVDYTFTDIGPSFVRRAEQDAAADGIVDMRFGLLDIARDPEAQGYGAGGYDLVLGYNVVHATPRLEATLGHLRTLLAPGGLLMLVETTRLRRWDEMVWGLTEGWWQFEDAPLRTTSPLLGLDAWETLLCGQGFESVAGFPRDAAARRASDVGLLLARRPGEAPRAAALREALREIRAAGGEALVLRADLADPAQLRAALADMRERFGPPDGVIHAAGLLGQGLIHDRTVEGMRPVFAAKAEGLLLLEVLLREQGMEPGLLVLCSSLAAVRPILGQVDYCAANAFLDAYAAHRAAAGVRAVSIGWGFWQELGMIGQARLPEAAKQRILDEIREKGRGDSGIEAFRCILGGAPPTHVLVAPDGLEGPATGGAAAPVPSVAPAWARPLAWPEGHPWFEACLVERPDTEAYVSRLGTGHWVLDEHRPFGQAVLPGTAFLELARAALDTHGPGRPVQWTDVYFLTPLVIEDGEKEVRTLLTRREAGFEFVVVSRLAAGADEWLEHARGEIGFLSGEPPAPLDPAAAALRCGEADIPIMPGEDHPLAARVRGFTPHWRCFERLRLGTGQGLATLRLAPEFVGETDTMPLHPALSDMATGFLSMAEHFEAGVPFCYRQVRLWRPLPPAVHSHVRAVGAASRQERSYDATVTDAEGCVLLEVAGFTLRTPEPWREAESAAPGENFSAVIDHPGSLATLGLRPDHRHPPGPGEVEVEVTAAGVNFIEVLYALGMLPEPPGGEVRFGLECAGTVARVGEGVAGLRPGDAVFGFAPRAFSRFTTTAAAHVAPLPPHLSPEAGATLPAAFTTAYYALVTRGRLRCGERVLIHAAAGGVGLAAVTIARWRGAEVFATAGSDTKRDHLRGLGIRHVWDSRSLGFAEGVREATGGQGVDVVLNSLGGEFIPASLGVLARHGRFLELGKRDILGNGALALAPFEKHLSFTAIDVGPDLPEFTRVWRQVVRGIGRREFRPLPHRVFPVTDLAEAFEQMAQARHIGKLVVAMAGAAPGRVAPRRRHGRPLADIIGRGAERVAAEATQPPMPAASRDLAPRAAPLDRAHARPAMPTPYRAPEGATEAGVVAVWEELLGVSGIGADDNFFELRGDSLLAAQVTSRLYAEFQVKLPLSSLFEHPTVAELAARIERQRQSLRELATAPLAQRAETEVEHEL